MNFLLDENVPISIKDVIHDLGFDVFTLHDFNMLGIQNGEVAFSIKNTILLHFCEKILEKYHF